MGVARYYVGRVVRGCLPEPAVRGLRHAREAWASWRRNAAHERLAREHGPLTPAALREELIQHGVRGDGVLVVHSSFGAFANFSGTASDVLDVLLELVGERGTLMMPSQPAATATRFDVLRTPSSTGMLCELFRRTDGTLRSRHPGQAVCARGPLAEQLTCEHHLEPWGCGRLSPFAKLLQHDSQILGLGVTPVYNTFLHVIEDLDVAGYPWPIYSGRKRVCQVIDEERHEFTFEFPVREDAVLSRMNQPRLARHLSRAAQTVFEVQGVPCFLSHPTALMAEMKELATHGIVLYS